MPTLTEIEAACNMVLARLSSAPSTSEEWGTIVRALKKATKLSERKYNDVVMVELEDSDE